MSEMSETRRRAVNSLTTTKWLKAGESGRVLIPVSFDVADTARDALDNAERMIAAHDCEPGDGFSVWKAAHRWEVTYIVTRKAAATQESML